MKAPRITFRVESTFDPCSKVLGHERFISVTQRDLLVFENTLYRKRVFGSTADEADREVERCYEVLNNKYAADPQNNPLPIVRKDK